MNTFLLTWNPDRWQWRALPKLIRGIESDGWLKYRWSCGVTKSIVAGDRVFLLRQGVEPRGIIGSGWVSRGSYEGPHWDRELAAEGKKALFIGVRFDVLFNADAKPLPDPIFKREKLDKGVLKQMHWDAFASGTSIPHVAAAQFEKEWAQFLDSQGKNQGLGRTGAERQPDETEPGKYTEGAVKRVYVNAYERNHKARVTCLQHHRFNCSVCDFNFEQTYGDIGLGFIHVHHLKPLAEIGQQYELDPVKDLRPVCPNCHAMLHTKKPPYSIEELKKKLQR